MDEKELELLFNAMSKQFDVGNWETFKSKMTNTESRKKFYDAISNEGLDLGDYNEYEQRLSGVKKKEPSVSPAPSLEEVTPSQLPTPVQEQDEFGVGIPEISEEKVGLDPITQAQEYKRLKEQKIYPSEQELLTSRGMAQPYSDTKSVEEAEKIREEYKKNRGIDLDELYEETKDLTPNDYGRAGFSKTELIEDREANKPIYERKLARLKWSNKLENKLAQARIDNNITPEEYQSIDATIKSSLANTRVGDFEQQRENIRSISNIVKSYAPEFQKEIMPQFATEMAKVYGMAFEKNLDASYSKSEESKYLDKNSYLAYRYIQDVDPEKAEQYKRLFIDKKQIEGDENAVKGYNMLMGNLKETGIALQKKAIQEEINNLQRISTKAGGLTEEQVQIAEKYETKLKELDAEEDKLDQEFPERQINRAEDAVVELLGSRLGGVSGFFARKLGQGGRALRNTFRGIWLMASEPFMSEESNAVRDLALMGEYKTEEEPYKVSGKQKGLITEKLSIDPELQPQVDAIVNDKNLEGEAKRLKLFELFMKNPDKYGMTPVLNGKLNINPVTILEGVGDIASSLVPFMLGGGISKAAGLAGSARAAIVTNFATGLSSSFYDNYNAALQEGKPTSEAYKTAMVNSAIDGAVIAGAGTVEKVRGMFAKSKTAAANILSKVSDDYIQKIIDKGVPKGLRAFKEEIKERVLALPSQLKQGAKAGLEFESVATLGEEAKSAINDTPIDRTQRLKQSILGVINFAGLSGIGGQLGFRKMNDIDKGGILMMGENPQGFRLENKKLLDNGTFTKEQYQEKETIIDRAEKAYKEIPQSVNGKKLSEKQKADYLVNLIIKNDNKQASESLPPKQAEEAKMQAMVADYKNQYILEDAKEEALKQRRIEIEQEIEKGTADEKTLTKLQAEKTAIDEIISTEPISAEPKQGGVEGEVEGVVPTEITTSEKPTVEEGVQPSAEPTGQGVAERTPTVLEETKAEQPTVSEKVNILSDEKELSKEFDESRLDDLSYLSYLNDKYGEKIKGIKNEIFNLSKLLKDKLDASTYLSKYGDNPFADKVSFYKKQLASANKYIKEAKENIKKIASPEVKKEEPKEIKLIRIIKKENTGRDYDMYHIEYPDGSREFVKEEKYQELISSPTEIKAEIKPEEPAITKEEPTTPTEPIKAEEKVTVEEGKGAGEEPPKPPIRNEFVYKGSKKERERAVITHLREAKEVPEFFKEKLKTNKRGTTYKVANMSEADAVGKGIVESLGIEDALEVAKSQLVHPSVAGGIYGQSLDAIWAKEKAAREAGNIAEADRLAEMWADTSLDFAEQATAGGQFNAQIAHFYKSSPMGIVMRNKKEMTKKMGEWLEVNEENAKEIYEEIKKTETGEKAVREDFEKIRKEERNKERAEKKAKIFEKIDKEIAKWTDKLTPKGTKGIEKQGIGTEEIMKAVGASMKLAYEAGEAITKIVEDAVNYISEKLGTENWDKEQFKKEWLDKLAEKEVDLESKYKGQIAELERRISEKDFSAEQYKEKKTLTEKEQAAKDELEEVRKKYNEAKKQSPEYIEKAAKNFLDRFRKKMKGLDESQKKKIIKESSRKLIESGALEYEDFKKIIADALGYKEFTPEQINKIEELTSKINGFNGLLDEMVKDPSEITIEKFDKAQQDNLEAQMELGTIVTPSSDLISTLKAIYTGSLLGVPTLMKNIGQNVIAQWTLRLPKAVFLQLLELGAYGIASIKDKFVGGQPPALPNRNLALAQIAYFKQGKLGLKAASFDFMKGVKRPEFFSTKEYQSTLSPRKALKDLKLWKSGEINLSNRDLADRLLRATLGWQPDFILRGMGFGDIVFRYAAQGSKAVQIAVQELGLKDNTAEMDVFFRVPQQYSYKLFREKGFSEKEALEMSKEVEAAIVEEGQKAVFQEDNWLSKTSEWAENSLRTKPDESKRVKAAKEIASLTKTKVFPFVKIPANVYWAYFKAANPYFTIALALWDGATAMKNSKDGKTALARKYQDRSLDNLAHAAVGMGMIQMADYWISQGLVNTSNDEETTAKERESEKLFGKQNQLNLGKILGNEDFFVDLSWFGPIGTILDTRARMAEKKKRKELKWEIPEASILEEAFDNVAFSMGAALNTLVFDQAGRLYDAVTNRDKFSQYIVQDVMNLSNMVTGATIPAFSKAMLPYEARLKGDNIWETLNNNLKYRNGLYRLLTSNPPAKVSIWGEKITKKEGLGATISNVLGFEQGVKESRFGLMLYDDFAKTQNLEFFPPTVPNYVTVNGKKVKLKVSEHEDLKEFIGQNRKALVEPFVYGSGQFEKMGKSYSEMTDREKLIYLNKIYSAGRKIGLSLFMQKYPQYSNVDTEPEEIEETKEKE